MGQGIIGQDSTLLEALHFFSVYYGVVRQGKNIMY